MPSHPLWGLQAPQAHSEPTSIPLFQSPSLLMAGTHSSHLSPDFL
jgi:hypothetical protein